ncbi:MAG: hypothetical protein FJX56_03730 [Alphaproteobacteria bacterium]|nr:hypothetical protein [Alphaproteobacteria bacterium]
MPRRTAHPACDGRSEPRCGRDHRSVCGRAARSPRSPRRGSSVRQRALPSRHAQHLHRERRVDRAADVDDQRDPACDPVGLVLDRHHAEAWRCGLDDRNVAHQARERGYERARVCSELRKSDLAGALLGLAAEGAIGVAGAGLLPRVTLSGQLGYEEVDSKIRREDFGKSFRRGQDRLTLTVTQNLFDGERKSAQKESAEFSHALAADTLESALQNVLFEGTNAYIDVLCQLTLVRLAEANERTIAIQLNLEDERVRRGSGIAVDALLAKSRLQLAKEQRVVFEGNMQQAADRFTQVFDKVPSPPAMIDPLPPYRLLPDTFDTAITIALQNNPLVANASRLIDVARANQRIAASGYYPRVDVVGVANWEDDINAVPGIRRDWSVLLRSTWDLFAGFSTLSATAQAASQYASSLNNHVFVNRKVAEEVRLA